MENTDKHMYTNTQLHHTTHTQFKFRFWSGTVQWIHFVSSQEITAFRQIPCHFKR